jgi:hypothetical protein
MNVEKLNKLSQIIIEDNKKNNIASLLANIVNNLQNMINQPNQPAYQSEVSNNLTQLYAVLRKSELNKLSPAWNQILHDLNVDNILGNRLAIRIEEIFNRNTITPQTALNELGVLNQDFSKMITGFSDTRNGLIELKIGSDELEFNTSEIGILIPRKYLDNSLEKLGTEIREISFIINTFSELINGKKENIILRSLSTSEPFITIASSIAIAAGISKAIGYLIDNYKKLLEIRKLKNELKKQGVEEENLKGIEDHSNKFMETAIESLIIEVKTDFFNPSIEKGRENEIVNSLRISLNKLANRIDNGFNFEVRISLPESIENLGEADKQNIRKINEASVNLEFMKNSGEPILSLPEKNKTEK